MIKKSDHQFFKYATKTAIKRKNKEINCRLFPESIDDINERTPANNNENASLNDIISSFLNTEPSPRSIDSDIKAFEGTKERTEKLEKVYKALKTIQATSTTVERTFSIAGNIKTKVRNRLAGDKLNILVFLKSYFLNNQN